MFTSWFFSGHFVRLFFLNQSVGIKYPGIMEDKIMQMFICVYFDFIIPRKDQESHNINRKYINNNKIFLTYLLYTSNIQYLKKLVT